MLTTFEIQDIKAFRTWRYLINTNQPEGAEIVARSLEERNIVRNGIYTGKDQIEGTPAFINEIEKIYSNENTI